MKHVVIVAHGRSGSTLLGGILNAIDGWHIKGENHNFAWHLYQSEQSLAAARKAAGDKSGLPTSVWHGIERVDADVFRQRIAGLLKVTLAENAPVTPLRCCGFKEIRFFEIFGHDPTGETLRAYLKFLGECLAPCKFVLLTRDPEATSRSAWWKNSDHDKVVREFAAFDQFCRQYAQAERAAAFHITYDDIVTRSATLDGLFDFLEAQLSPERLSTVLGTMHSYSVTTSSPAAIARARNTNTRHPDLIEADRLQANGMYVQAREAYGQAVRSMLAAGHADIPMDAVLRGGQRAFQPWTSRNHKIAYVSMPKVACTSFGRIIFEIENNAQFVKDKLTIHDYYRKREPVVPTLDAYSDFFKFAVIRDPVERFVSGYRNRVLKNLALAGRRGYRKGRIDNPDINLFAFDLDRWMEQNLEIFAHLCPQYLRLGPSLATYNAIVPIETTEAFVGQLSERVGRNLAMPTNNASDSHVGLFSLSPEALEHLIKVYSKDYALLAEYYTPERIRAKHAKAVPHPPLPPQQRPVRRWYDLLQQ